MKVAIVHYWLVKMRGGEKVLESLCELFPDADLYTHVYDPGAISPVIKKHKITTTFIHKLPWAKRLYQSYLPLMPFALKRIRLDEYDLVISCESGPAKGVSLSPGTRHICYCHTPMRYLWDLYDVYLENANWLTGMFMRWLVPWLRRWDLHTAEGVDTFVANSNFVRQRIQNIYGRDAHVIYPPVAVDRFSIAEQPGDYYLYAGELTQYKQPQLAVDAFNLSGRKLLVIGDGCMLDSLQARARDNIHFLGRVSFEQLKHYFSHCRALVFPGIEDFGIIPVEVMASGRPVVAYRSGGALETITEGKTGVFFNEQSIASLNEAISVFEQKYHDFEPEAIKRHMEKFSTAHFSDDFKALVATSSVSDKCLNIQQ